MECVVVAFGNCHLAYGVIKYVVHFWVSDQLDAQLRHIKRFFYYYDPLQVSSNSVLIIRWSNCINTTSGIVFSASDRPVCRLLLNLHARRSLTENTVPDAVLIQSDLLMISTELLETCRGL